MKRIFFIIVSIALFGAGCTPLQQPVVSQPSISDSEEIISPMVVPTDAETELWIVKQVTDKQILYAPIEWFTGEQATAEATKDGCKEDCTPGGFYWRYKNGPDAFETWTLSDTSSIQVQLICNREDCLPDNPSKDGFKLMSYAKYLVADSLCRTTPLDCMYYSIGTGMDFFKVTFSKDNSILQLLEWYVP